MRILLVCFCLVVLNAGPILPPIYQISFNETARVVTTGITTGTIFMDTVNGLEKIQRVNGYHDRYCGTVFKTAGTPCNHYVVDGKRYLDFPDKKYCCFCCDSAHGCGVISSDWMSNATFLGNVTLYGEELSKWEIKGLQSNFYYHKNDAVMTPRRLEQGTDDIMDFIGYRIGPIDRSIFALPTYCTEKCGPLTICAGLRGEKQISSE